MAQWREISERERAKKRGVTRVVSLGVLGVCTWVVIFAGGVLLDSEPFRNELLGKAPPKSVASSGASAAGAGGRIDLVRFRDGTVVTGAATSSSDESLPVPTPEMTAPATEREASLSRVSLGQASSRKAALLAEAVGAESAVNIVRLADGTIVTSMDVSPAAPSLDAAQAAEAPAIVVGDSLPSVSADAASHGGGPTLQGFSHGLATFAAATTLFAPLNAVILALLAALCGGCASWLAHKDDEVPDSATPEERKKLEQQISIWKEPPLGAMLRGFAVYLTVIAGVYVTGGDPFSTDGSQTMRADQYIRFAGTVSLLSFVVGYDPTRIRSLIDAVPGLGKK